MVECLSTDQMLYFLGLVISVVDFLPDGSIKVADVVWTFNEAKNLWCR